MLVDTHLQEWVVLPLRPSPSSPSLPVSPLALSCYTTKSSEIQDLVFRLLELVSLTEEGLPAATTLLTVIKR